MPESRKLQRIDPDRLAGYIARQPRIEKLKISEDAIKRLIDLLCHPDWHKQAKGWEDAKSLAKKYDLIILLAFTDYTNCHCCQSLEANVFNKCGFGAWCFWSGVILVNIDAKNMTSQDAQLFAQFNVHYVPTVFGLSPDAEILGQITNNACGGAGYAAWIKEFKDITQMHRSPFVIPKKS
jgi:hypothetical protein